MTSNFKKKKISGHNSTDDKYIYITPHIHDLCLFDLNPRFGVLHASLQKSNV